ncbi:unnamed protein product, partial [Polarella glacialis]
ALSRRAVRRCQRLLRVHRFAAVGSGSQPQTGGASRWIGGISEIADRYDAFLFDLWGVIHNGTTAFPWALETLRELKRQGKPVVFLSNSSRRHDTNRAALTKLGVSPDLYAALVTSGEETWRALAGESGGSGVLALPPEILAAKRILTFGNGADDVEYVSSLAGRLAASAAEADLLLARGCSSLYEGQSQ